MITRAPSEQGFTLVEMLVALAVFSIAALSLMRLSGYAISTTADLDARSVASLVVRNEAALISTDPGAIVRGTTSSTVINAGRTFTVARSVTPTADQRLVRIDLLAVEQSSAARAAATFVKRVQ